jgi:NADH-quinone oxidoreductase subunit D
VRPPSREEAMSYKDDHIPMATVLADGNDPSRTIAYSETGEDGEQYMWLNMGPSHPATHGTIKIMVKLSGEEIRDADVDIGYLHRAFEKSCETHTWTQAQVFTDRLNYLSAMINNCGYMMAVEKLFDIEVTDRCKVVRTLMSEVSRLGDHATCIGASAMELGAMTAFLYFIKMREWMWELVEDVCGARVTTNWAKIGGLWDDLPEGFSEKCRSTIPRSRDVIAEVDKLLTRNRIFVDRMQGVGGISKEDAISYGITGPLLRATGVPFDLRKDEPYLAYGWFDFDVPVGTRGDNYDRYLVRMEEMRQSLRIIEQCLDNLPAGPVDVDDKRVSYPPLGRVYTEMEALIHHFKLWMRGPGQGIRPPIGEAYSRVEGANGELGFYVISDGSDQPYRVRCRPPCLPPMNALRQLLVGGMVADLVPTFGSVNMIGGELDR